MTSNRLFSALLLLVCAAQGATRAHATTVTQLSSASDLSHNDTSLVITTPVGTVSPGNSISFNNGNDRLTFSRASGQFEVDQANYNYGDTAFANNTMLVGAGGFQGPGDGGSITLTFAVPVIQFGLNIEDFQPTGSHYSVQFFAKDAAGKPISNDSNPSYFYSNGCADNSCLSFEGLTVSGDAISTIVFSDYPNGAGSNDLMFGNIQYATAGTALQAPPAVTPEPSSLVLLGTGILGVATFGRRAPSRLKKG